MKKTREFVGLCALADGRVVAVGGQHHSVGGELGGKVLSSAEILSVKHHRHDHRTKHAAGSSGATAPILPPPLLTTWGKWGKLPDMGAKRYGAGVATATDGRIFVAGGKVDASTFLSSAEGLDVQSKSWAPLPPMSCKRFAPGACKSLVSCCLMRSYVACCARAAVKLIGSVRTRHAF